jgi:DNA-binding ferritin-like protein
MSISSPRCGDATAIQPQASASIPAVSAAPSKQPGTAKHCSDEELVESFHEDGITIKQFLSEMLRRYESLLSSYLSSRGLVRGVADDLAANVIENFVLSVQKAKELE